VTGIGSSGAILACAGTSFAGAAVGALLMRRS
jgi:hypothetical protein